MVDKLIAWINYGSDALKTIGKAMAVIRDGWPNKPSFNNVENIKKENDTDNTTSK